MSGSVSPFAAASRLPPPNSESSHDSASYTSTASTSDYGSRSPALGMQHLISRHITSFLPYCCYELGIKIGGDKLAH